MHAAITVTGNYGETTYVLPSSEAAYYIAGRLRRFGFTVTEPVPTSQPVTDIGNLFPGGPWEIGS